MGHYVAYSKDIAVVVGKKLVLHSRQLRSGLTELKVSFKKIKMFPGNYCVLEQRSIICSFLIQEAANKVNSQSLESN